MTLEDAEENIFSNNKRKKRKSSRHLERQENVPLLLQAPAHATER